MKELVSPKQLAQAISVSESSLKRWCDKGVIPAVYTAGGHRRIPVNGVLSYLRERGLQIQHPEILGLPPATTGGQARKISSEQERLVSAMISGSEEVCIEIVFNLYLANCPVSTICDEVLATTFHEIGDRWGCGDVAVYQERRACELCLRIIHELRRALPELPSSAPIAIGGTLDGDPYTLASSMSELVLRDTGWNANSMGNMLPFASMRQALRDTNARFLWVSVSSIRDKEEFLAEFEELSTLAFNLDATLAVGGKALVEEIRREMKYSAFCDNFRHLQTVAEQSLKKVHSN
ncbi:B12-binding domain-containing protein [Thalassoglobus sp. JC818]|uniref:B12-binding domain-containing protein n=1 Tax=Thalassoglobus sp. JC818 TaxID=3232136 RepID=UPI0034590028